MKIKVSAKAVALSLAVAMLARVSFGQSIAYAIPVKGPATIVAPQYLGTLHEFPFVGDIRVDALPGFAAANSAPALGLAFSKPFSLGTDVDLWIGGHAVIVQGFPASYGLYLGFGWRLD